VKIMGGVPERYAADVRRGAEARITFDVFPGETYTAPVTFVGSTVNAQNRTFPVEVVMPNPKGLIKPEMVANVSLARRELTDAVVVPQDALIRVENGYIVFVAAERGGSVVAEARPVELGPSRRNLVVVASGLESGERIVVVGQKSVAAGDRLNVVGTR
jgi:RND family efflux transporter MFP subunit